jgi:hypothetical protein
MSATQPLPSETWEPTFAKLPYREREVLKDHFGLRPEMLRQPLQNIAAKFHVTHERIRQVHTRAMGRLRKTNAGLIPVLEAYAAELEMAPLQEVKVDVAEEVHTDDE